MTNVYSIPPHPETIKALRKLEHGASHIGVVKGHPAHPGCAGCKIRAADGNVVHIYPSQRDLEFKFEVFPIQAESVQSEGEVEWKTLNLIAPISVTLLETEEWLDPTVPCGEALGENPIMQCQGLPGSASENAIVVCRFVGGVRLRGADGRSILVATASFPYTLHVQDIAEDERFFPNAYQPVA